MSFVDTAAENVVDFADELVREGYNRARETVAGAYHRTVAFLTTRKRAYQLVFTSSAGQICLADLAKFCRAEQSCFDPDPRLHAALEGRREVWLRICSHLNLNPQELYALYSGHKLAIGD